MITKTAKITGLIISIVAAMAFFHIWWLHPGLTKMEMLQDHWSLLLQIFLGYGVFQLGEINEKVKN